MLVRGLNRLDMVVNDVLSHLIASHHILSTSALSVTVSHLVGEQVI